MTHLQSKKHSIIACLTTATLLMLSSYSLADQKVVTDNNNNPIRNSYGSCVLTKWSVDNNICNSSQVQQGTKSVSAPPKKTINFTDADRTVFFGFDRYELTDQAKKKLKKLAKKSTIKGQIYDGLIVGYADRIGTSDYNQKLSERRAKTVADYLANKGMRIKKVELRSEGERKAQGSCVAKKLTNQELIKCLSKDRRVEVELELRNVKYN